MTLITTFLTAIGLSMDAFAVAITEGMSIRKRMLSSAILFGLFFGVFQALMPMLGWFAGNILHAFPIAKWDHWIAFILLALIGAKMIKESTDTKPIAREHRHGLRLMVGLSIATSIDALAVGVGLSFLNVNIIATALIIGCITFAFSFAGIYLGRLIGSFLANRAELIGGLVLIAIGLKILFEHSV